MTREEIIRMAKEAGLYTHREVQPEIERFARAIEAQVIERCAQTVWPDDIKYWSEEETTAMVSAWNRTQDKHGLTETLIVVCASVLKMKAAAIRGDSHAE